MSGAVFILTTGVMGAGKSYMRCASFLADSWLAEPTKRVHLSNFPVDFDGLSKVAERKYGMSAEEVRYRVRVIPKDVMEQWRNAGCTRIGKENGREALAAVSGVWNWIGSGDERAPSFEEMQGGHIAIDEAHHLLPSNEAKLRRDAWNYYIGEIRHEGMSIEFLTQHLNKMDKRIPTQAAQRYTITNQETERDPFFGVLLSDWYQLRAKLEGYWSPGIIELEERNVNGKWKTSSVRKANLLPEYFRIYNSFNAPEKRGEGQRPKRQWEVCTWSELLRWFAWRNWLRMVFSRLTGALLVIVFCLGGGLQWALLFFLSSFGAMAAPGDVAMPKKDKRVGVEQKETVEIQTIEQTANSYTYTEGGESKTITMDELPILLMEANQLRESLRIAEQESIDKTQQIEVLRGDGVSLVGMTPDSAWLNSGEIITVGKQVWTARIAGDTVETIDYESRLVGFTSGLVVGFGVSNEFGRIDTKWQSSMEGSVSGLPPGTATSGRGRDNGNNYIDSGRRNAARGISSVAEPDGGYINSVGRESGQRFSQSGNIESDALRNIERIEQAPIRSRSGTSGVVFHRGPDPTR
jgi:hypothetical protein